MNTIAIVQARMGSTRLPGKVLAEICGVPMLGFLLQRLSRSAELDRTVVATTTNDHDDLLVDWLESNGVSYFRGSENDVLDRFWQCARIHEADVVVRVTADDPLKDPEIIDQALSELRAAVGIDYVSNNIRPTFPEGLDIEAFTFQTLTRAHQQATLQSEREHVTPYIWKNPNQFNLRCFEMEPNLSSWRWTVDKPEDLTFIRTVMSHFGNEINTSYKDIIRLILTKPELAQINSGTVRNEGYLKTIAMEKGYE
jgi:spore coat polysaccharide biosynthesis protein SpsF